MDYAAELLKIRTLDTKKRIKFILLFGSAAQGTNHILSDVDLAIYYAGTKRERSDFLQRVYGVLSQKIDVSIFQDLPLAVQREVISGKLVYCVDDNLMTNEFVRVVKSYRYYGPHLKTYFNALEAAMLGE